MYADAYGNPEVPEPAPGRENFQMFRTDPTTRENFDRLTARRVLQEPSSTEEGLEPGVFCSQCGSEACMRKARMCRSQERFALTKIIYQGWVSQLTFESFTFEGAKPYEMEALRRGVNRMQRQWVDELEARERNVITRKALKQSFMSGNRG